MYTEHVERAHHESKSNLDAVGRPVVAVELVDVDADKEDVARLPAATARVAALTAIPAGSGGLAVEHHVPARIVIAVVEAVQEAFVDPIAVTGHVRSVRV